MNPRLIASLGAMCLFNLTAASGGGLPEPGLVMYGAVRNAANGNALLTTGTLTWTITPASGSSITMTAQLIDIGGQYSYLVRVPFESIVGSMTPSTNVLRLNGAATSYYRTNGAFTFGSNTHVATIASTNLGNFTFGPADRGRLDVVDLTVTAPGVGSVVGRPSIGPAQILANGQFQLTVNGAIGQSYSLLASTNLFNWTLIRAFVCTISPMIIYDPMASNFVRRFYQIGPASTNGSIAAPRLALTASGAGSNPVTLMLSCSPGLSYHIDASIDLVTWIPLTNFVSTNATMYVGDSAATNYPRRFYRAVSP